MPDALLLRGQPGSVVNGLGRSRLVKWCKLPL